ncbi:MAG: sulfotransferase [Planctomycetota bacterium]|nr:sulfotransferase [Planctomycetota bacterium]
MQTHPRHAGASCLLGEVIAEGGDARRGASVITEAIGGTNDSTSQAGLFGSLGIIYAESGQSDNAKRAFLRASELAPNNPHTLANLGKICQDRNELQEAEAYLEESLKIDPGLTSALGSLAAVLVQKGNVAKAVESVECILQRIPEHVGPYIDLSVLEEMGAYRLSPDQIARMEHLRQSELPPKDACRLLGALGRVFDRRHDYEKAFRFCEKANHIRRSLMRKENRHCDIEGRRLLVDATIDAFDRAFFDRVRSCGLDSERSILIVGMPRTGKTLVEQILCVDDRVAGAGEHLGLFLHAKKVARETEGDYPACISLLEAPAIRALAEKHLQFLDTLGGGAEQVISTRSGNFMHLGLFRTMFPNARIIHCRRDPLDTCVSCYLQDFPNLSYGASQEELAHYYRQYERMMSHWNQVLTPSIHEVVYEDLVAQPESTIKALCDYCGFAWDQRYLSFYQNSRPVRSEDQRGVHRPFESTKVGIGKRYESFVQPMMEVLGLAPIPHRQSSDHS